LNDAWIFTALLRPELKSRADELLASKSKIKKLYPVPKRDRATNSKRLDSDIGRVFRDQHDRGIFETNIVSIVSRIEAFIQECVTIAILDTPEKLSVICDRNGIPLNIFLEHEDRDDVLASFIALRCQDLMFGKPSDYIAKASKILSIAIDEDLAGKYIEMKATRDLIVHNRGEINKLYLEKAGDHARGNLGQLLAVDAAYFEDVIVNAKLLSGSIQRETEAKYG